jgi:flavin reductase (DIM6/NTAB) family NADH-FMN oxidoreductase RutF
MAEQPIEIKAPIAWLPAGLISWYASDGSPITLVTAWVALVGGDNPRIRTAWHGRHETLSRFWPGGDFVLNVPYEKELDKIRKVMSQGKLCLNAQDSLGYTCSSGVVAIAPRLLDCAVQIECLAGRLIDSDFDTELCGDVVRVHRDGIVIDTTDIPDLCAIQPLIPLGNP